MSDKFVLSSPFSYNSDKEYFLNDQFSFWDEIAKKCIHWDKMYDDIFEENNGKYKWFKNGLFNTCYNVLDKHIINGRGNEIAFVHEIPGKNITYKITYQELYDKVVRLSRSLKNMGVSKGDIVAIHMPNCFEAIISILASSRIGSIHTVVYGGFTGVHLNDILERCKPKIIITTNYGYSFDTLVYYYDLLKESLLTSQFKPEKIILFKRQDIEEGNKDFDWNEFENLKDWNELIDENIEPLYEWEKLNPDHPLYLVFTSGTTNKPKTILGETGGILIGLNYLMKTVYGFNENDVYLLMVGFPWTISQCIGIFGCLIVGMKMAFVEGYYGDQCNICDNFWNIVPKNKVSGFLIIPTFVRKLMIQDPNGEIASKYDLSTIKKVIIGSEKSSVSILDYLKKIIKKPVVCNEYGQSESSLSVCVNLPNQFPIRNDSIGKPLPGFNIKIVNKNKDTGEVYEVKTGEIGEIVLKQPVFPSAIQKLFNDDENQSLYKNNYTNEYPGYLRTKDLAHYDEEGYFYYASRNDDCIYYSHSLINCALLENEINKHPNVNDSCIIGLKDNIYGQLPLALIILQNNNDFNLNKFREEIEEIKKLNLSLSLSVNMNLVIVKDFPKSNNGKKLKNILTSIFNGENFTIPAILSNPSCIDDLINQYNKFNNQ